MSNPPSVWGIATYTGEVSTQKPVALMKLRDRIENWQGDAMSGERGADISLGYVNVGKARRELRIRLGENVIPFKNRVKGN